MNSRHKLRELAMTSLYQHFLLQKDIKECVYDNSETNEIDPFLYTVTIDAIRYQDVYIDKINAAIRQDWTFARLGFVEQALLMMAACALDLETAPKAEAVTARILEVKEEAQLIAAALAEYEG